MLTRMILVIAVCAVSLGAQATDSEARFTRWLDRIAQAQLDKREAEIKQINTVEAAERRKEQVRKKIFELIGGLPDYSGPLNAEVTGRIDKHNYIIEKVIFESLPHFYVTGNLYRPSKSGHYPGVLIQLGHWTNWMRVVTPLAGNFRYRYLSEGDPPYLDDLLK